MKVLSQLDPNYYKDQIESRNKREIMLNLENAKLGAEIQVIKN